MKNVIRKPKIYLYVGVPSIALHAFILFKIICLGLNEPGWFMLTPLFLSLLIQFTYLTLLRLNWKVQINDNNIIVRNCFRMSKEYNINKLEQGAKTKPDIFFYLYFEGKRIARISVYDENWLAFPSFLKWHDTPRKNKKND